jgi:hypothetical protein
VLRNYFDFKPQPADVCGGHNSSYISPESLESFFVSCDLALTQLPQAKKKQKNSGGLQLT